MDFSALEDAPIEAPDVTPEKTKAKKQDVTPMVDGHFGPINHPLKEGQQPTTYVQLLGAPGRIQSLLKDMPINDYGQTGECYQEAWCFKRFAKDSKVQGVFWQKGIGTQESGALVHCKGPGGMCKQAINEVVAKEIATKSCDAAGVRLRWNATGYQSKKNKVTFVVIDQQPLFYGGVTYVLADKFNSGFPTVDFQRKTVCTCSQARAPTAPNTHAPNATRRSVCPTAMRAGHLWPISSQPSVTSRPGQKLSAFSSPAHTRPLLPAARDYSRPCVRDLSRLSSSLRCLMRWEQMMRSSLVRSKALLVMLCTLMNGCHGCWMVVLCMMMILNCLHDIFILQVLDVQGCPCCVFPTRNARYLMSRALNKLDTELAATQAAAMLNGSS